MQLVRTSRDTRYKGDEPWVLGIASSHNGAVCLLHGEEIVVSIQEERLTRSKRAVHPGGAGSLAIRYCLDYAGISAKQLDAVVLCPVGSKDSSYNDIHINPLLRTKGNDITTHVIPHHLGHAIGAYATSGFEKAAILIVDGRGSLWEDLSCEEQCIATKEQHLSLHGHAVEVRESVSIYCADGEHLRPVYKLLAAMPKSKPGPEPPGMPSFESLGNMYGSVAYQIFGSALDGAGKVMGLAPYGVPRLPREAFLEYQGERLVFKTAVCDQFKHDRRWPDCKDQYSDLAASVQAVLEEVLLKLVCLAKTKCPSANLCYAGGVALNSVANERMITRGPFDDVYIMPASEDSGTAIGAAYYGLWSICGKTTSKKMSIDSTGRTYEAKAFTAAICSVPGLLVEQYEDVTEPTVDLLANGNIVGWFHGRSELGPRALGCRSILCDPRRVEMKDILNSKVKFREGFRPFAPAILAEQVPEWFLSDSRANDSPFMLRVMCFRPDKRHLVPAVVHVDGTGRVQTVPKDSSLKLRALLQQFYRRTSVPILLNTSFNVAGEPIVETPEDAMSCFLFTGMDACVMGNYVIRKPDGFDIFSLVPALNVATFIFATEGLSACMHHTSAPSDSTRPIESLSADLLYSQGIPRTLPGYFGIVTVGPWGDLVHVLPLGFWDTLMKIDGRQTLRSLQDASANRIDHVARRDFAKCIASLHRIGAITFKAVAGQG